MGKRIWKRMVMLPQNGEVYAWWHLSLLAASFHDGTTTPSEDSYTGRDAIHACSTPNRDDISLIVSFKRIHSTTLLAIPVLLLSRPRSCQLWDKLSWSVICIGCVYLIVWWSSVSWLWVADKTFAVRGSANRPVPSECVDGIKHLQV